MCFFTITYAQSISISGGPVFSNMEWSTSFNQYLQYNREHPTYLGYQTAVRFNYLEKDNFKLSGEIEYIRLGANGTGYKDDGGGLIYPGHIETKFNFLSLKPQFVYLVWPQKCVTIKTSVGPSIDFLINYQEDQIMLAHYEKQNELNRILFGVSASLGLQLNFENTFIVLSYDPNFYMNQLVDYTSVIQLTSGEKI